MRAPGSSKPFLVVLGRLPLRNLQQPCDAGCRNPANVQIRPNARPLTQVVPVTDDHASSYAFAPGHGCKELQNNQLPDWPGIASEFGWALLSD